MAGYSFTDRPLKKYRDISNLTNGYMKVSNWGDKFGIIDMNGKLCVPCIYDSLDSVSCGYARFKRDTRYGYVDVEGRETIVKVADWEDFSNFKNGFATVKNDKDSFSLLGKNLDSLLEGKKKIQVGEKLVAAIESYGGYDFVMYNDAQEQVKTNNTDYTCVIEIGNGWAVYGPGYSKNGWGYMNNDGDEIIPRKYHKIESADEFGITAIDEHGVMHRFDYSGNLLFSNIGYTSQFKMGNESITLTADTKAELASLKAQKLREVKEKLIEDYSSEIDASLSSLDSESISSGEKTM